MRQVLGLLLLVALGGHADGVWDDIPAGKLGFPLGTYLTIEGEAAKPGPKVNSTCTLLVDTVNGKRLDAPVFIWIDSLKGSLPQTGRIVVRGYESGRMVGVPDEVAEKEHLPEPQAVWHFSRYFVVTSWVQPAGPVTLVPLPPPALLPPGQLGEPAKPDAPAPGSAADLDARLRRLREERDRLRRENEVAP